MIIIDSLSFGYFDHPQLISKFSALFKPGSRVGIAGPNGIGKSTLLKLVAGLITPQTGTVTIDGSDIQALPRSKRAQKIALMGVYSEPAFPFRVRDFVALGRAPYLDRWGRLTSEDQAKIDQSLNDFELNSFSDRFLTDLSTGERQRALLARVVTQDPQVLLLDEPMAYLDLPVQIEFLSYLETLSQTRDLTLMMVSHHLNSLARLCDIVILMGKNQSIWVGTPQEVLTERHLCDAFGTSIPISKNPESGLPVITV